MSLLQDGLLFVDSDVDCVNRYRDDCFMELIVISIREMANMKWDSVT